MRSVHTTLLRKRRLNRITQAVDNIVRYAKPGSNLLCLKYTDFSEIIASDSGMQGKPGTNLE